MYKVNWYTLCWNEITLLKMLLIIGKQLKIK